MILYTMLMFNFEMAMRFLNLTSCVLPEAQTTRSSICRGRARPKRLKPSIHVASGASKTNFDIWPVVFMKGCKCIGCDTMRSCPLPIIAIFQIMSGVWSNILSVMEYLYSQTVPSWSNMPRAGGLANAFRAFLYGQPWSLFNPAYPAYVLTNVYEIHWVNHLIFAVVVVNMCFYFYNTCIYIYIYIYI